MFLRGLRLLQVHPPVVNRTRTGCRTRILQEDNCTSALRHHLVFEMRVGHVNERSWPIRPTAAAELALEDVPHLCEVVSVKGKARPGLVPQKADIGLCRTIYSRMKEKLGLVVEPAHLPFHVINMLELRGMVPS